MGALKRPHRPPRSRGFTLIELLVVLVILGIAASMMFVDAMPGPRRSLVFEAERLAQLLVLARDEAQLRGRPIRLRTGSDGYAFESLSELRWQPVVDDPDLRPRSWDSATEVLVTRADGLREVEFGRESVDAPFVLRLARGEADVEIRADGLGRFDVR